MSHLLVHVIIHYWAHIHRYTYVYIYILYNPYISPYKLSSPRQPLYMPYIPYSTCQMLQVVAANESQLPSKMLAWGLLGGSEELCKCSPPQADRILGIWGSHCSKPKVIFYLLKGDGRSMIGIIGPIKGCKFT